YLLSVLPALCWIFTLILQELKWQKFFGVILAGTALMGGLLAHADYVQANTIVKLAEYLERKAPELQTLSPRPVHHWYYLADTFDGSQPYMVPLGWENVLPHQKLHKGDLFLRAY